MLNAVTAQYATLSDSQEIFAQVDHVYSNHKDLNRSKETEILQSILFTSATLVSATLICYLNYIRFQTVLGFFNLLVLKTHKRPVRSSIS